MKLTAKPERHYILRVEPGDSIAVVFDPAGVNAVSGDVNVVHVLTVSTVVLPDVSLALSFSFNNDLMYKTRPLQGAVPSLVACRDFGAHGLEFVLHREAPKITLNLEKIDLAELLRTGEDEDTD